MEFWSLLLAPLRLLAMFGGVETVTSWASDGRRDAANQALLQTEIERKLAIAEQARAARARGEVFIPPTDYDR